MPNDRAECTLPHVKIITDSTAFGRSIMPTAPDWSDVDRGNLSPLPDELVSAIYPDTAVLARGESGGLFEHLLLVESARRSQYDTLIELARENIALPDMTLCLAGEGRKFHGFKGRSWASPPGNIYLSVHFAPNRPIENFAVGFMTLAAVAVVQAIDRVNALRGRAGIKWVNDILIDGAKVCGVLAHCLTEGDLVTNAVLGIGLNVCTTPAVEPTEFVPLVSSLRDLASDSEAVTQATMLQHLIGALAGGYHVLLEDGCGSLLRFYRERSLVVGRDVAVLSDKATDNSTLIAEGRVTDIGDSLELHLKGLDEPVFSGRLILKK